MESCSITSIPPDCWVSICDFLCVREHIRLALSSASVHRQVTSPQAWHVVDFSDLSWVSNASDLDQLLRSGGTVVSRKHPHEVPGLACEKLCLAHCSHFEGDGLRLIAHMQTTSNKIRWLDLRGLFKIRDRDLQHLCPCGTSLTHLNLSMCRNVTGAGLRVLLPHLTALRSLNLSICKEVQSSQLGGALMLLAVAQAKQGRWNTGLGLRRLTLSGNTLFSVTQPTPQERIRWKEWLSGAAPDAEEQSSEVPLSLALAQLVSLTSLRLDSTATDNSGLVELTTLTNLTELDLSGCNPQEPLTEDGLLPLCSQTPHMRRLYLRYATFTSLDFLSCLPSLAVLDLTGADCSLVKDGVDALSVERRRRHKPTATTGTRAAEGFRTLLLPGLRLDDSALKPLLGWAHSLRVLDLTSWVLTDVGLSNVIAHLTGLTHLNLSGCNSLSSKGMSALRSLSNLQSISLNTCMFVDTTALRMLDPLSQSLHTLLLSDCYGVDDLCCVQIGQHFHRLTHLDLSHCARISDGGIEALTSLTRLHKLSLRNIQSITEEGIAALATPSMLSSLKGVDFRNCNSIRPSALAQLGFVTTSVSGRSSQATESGGQ